MRGLPAPRLRLVPRPRRDGPSGADRQRQGLPDQHRLGRGLHLPADQAPDIKPGRPWTNGKAERFNRTLQDRWAYRQIWTSNDARTAALDDFLVFYNTVRGHSSLEGNTPLSRLAA